MSSDMPNIFENLIIGAFAKAAGVNVKTIHYCPEMFSKFAGRSRPFSLLYPHGWHLPLRVRLFIGFLVEKLAH